MSDQRGRVGVVEPPVGAGIGRRCLRWAWISVALTPVGFVLGMLLGEALAAAQGFEGGSDVFPPARVVLLAGLPAMVVLLAPAVPGIVLGLRARHHGASAGWVPALIGALVVVSAVLANSLPLVLGGWAS